MTSIIIITVVSNTVKGVFLWFVTATHTFMDRKY